MLSLPKRLIDRPKDLTYKELKPILEGLGYTLDRVKGTKFVFKKDNKIVTFHLPHRFKTFQAYQVTQIIHRLEKNEGDIYGV